MDVDGISVQCGSVRQRASRDPGAPAKVRVTVSGQVDSGSLTVRGPRRSFWGWFRRTR
ncbi:MAG: hypothetical protein ABIS86_02435 [Streptosporangiaceae bacterium]